LIYQNIRKEKSIFFLYFNLMIPVRIVNCFFPEPPETGPAGRGKKIAARPGRDAAERIGPE
jgi:hypothetical protein